MTSESTAGQEHKILYPFDSYPYIAIIDPLTGMAPQHKSFLVFYAHGCVTYTRHFLLMM